MATNGVQFQSIQIYYNHPQLSPISYRVSLKFIFKPRPVVNVRMVVDNMTL